ncbi:MAG TPA: hypothetical protein VNN22_01420 [Verrucomicrobiae bacterium]|nr:hypothetical protein [Verrucomicrobiae bacterium]
MQKKINILFLPLLLCLSSWAQQTNLLNSSYSVSPKLSQFIIDHPQASKLLTNILSEAFSNRTVQLYYYYSDDKSIPSAFHYYPSESVVGITIRENQLPSDEFISLVFEVLNSESEKHFQDLYQKAQLGSISRTNFAQEIMKVEFKAAKRTRDLIGSLKLSDKEMAESKQCRRFIECPNEFEDFLSYTEKVNQITNALRRDPIKEYEMQYDSLRKTQ